MIAVLVIPDSEIRWRRIELHSWPFVLRVKEEEAKSRALRLMFGLSSLLQPAYHGQPVNFEELISVLNEFMSRASCGEFETRLELLWAFHSQLLANGEGE
jgi:midasin (ATPase involved in ribosome maturation)